jgi:PTH1 family peptidyl-tRNA hydrolase
MLIFAGLGNPGEKYRLHRHNVGFMAVDTIHEVHGFSPWSRKGRAEIAEGRLDGKKILLLKPQTYMNESGQAVGEIARFYKLEPQSVTVFYDELDLAPFKVKVKRGGGAAGHNGIRSVAAHIGENFRRVRLGIGHPGMREKVTGHVLGNYAKAEMDDLAAMLGAVAAEAHWLAAGDDARFMNDVALRMAA